MKEDEHVDITVEELAAVTAGRHARIPCQASLTRRPVAYFPTSSDLIIDLSPAGYAQFNQVYINLSSRESLVEACPSTLIRG